MNGASQFEGGGFMPSQATQSTDTGLSPAKNRESQVLLPLTLKQINEAIRANNVSPTVDGVEIGNVKLVGMLLNKSQRPTDVSFTIDDGTGRIDCQRWFTDIFDATETEDIPNDTYVRVHGQMKQFHGKRKLVVFSVRPVTDFNEIAYHFIECMYVHVQNSRLEAQVQNQSNVTNPAMNTPPKQNIFQEPASNQAFEQHSSVLKSIDRMVLDHMRKFSRGETGVHIEEVAKQFNLSLDKVKGIIAELEAEGLVYSTIDDCHYKSTE